MANFPEKSENFPVYQLALQKWKQWIEFRSIVAKGKGCIDREAFLPYLSRT